MTREWLASLANYEVTQKWGGGGGGGGGGGAGGTYHIIHVYQLTIKKWASTVKKWGARAPPPPLVSLASRTSFLLFFLQGKGKKKVSLVTIARFS